MSVLEAFFFGVAAGFVLMAIIVHFVCDHYTKAGLKRLARRLNSSQESDPERQHVHQEDGAPEEEH
jgi:hypothetical protein